MSPQPVPRVGRSERTRAAILNATLDFIWSHPFRDMTVSTLMDSTGLSRSAFYQYFKDVHEVMESLLDMLRDEVFAATGAWFEGDGDPVEVWIPKKGIGKASNDPAKIEMFQEIYRELRELLGIDPSGSVLITALNGSKVKSKDVPNTPRTFRDIILDFIKDFLKDHPILSKILLSQPFIAKLLQN